MTNKRVFSEKMTKVSTPKGQVVNAVYKTDDYSIFQLSKFNRNIILRRELIEQAEEGIISPIIVNENLMVIDGQHRLKASEKVGAPVEYVIKQGLDEHDIVRMNTVQKPWSLANHIEAWANQGKDEYIKLLNLLNNYYGNTTVVTQVALDVNTMKKARPIIESGEFKFVNYEKTVEFLSYLRRFKEETNVPYKSKLSQAIYELFKISKFDRERLIHKVIGTDLNEELKVKTLNKSDALQRLLDAYNKMLSEESKSFINYYITSSGTIIIDEEKADWVNSRL